MIKTVKLNCGAKLVLEYIPHVQSVATGIWIGTGAVNEDASVSGISHFAEHMMFKGTENRSAKEIAGDIDKIGGQFNAFTGKEATCYYVKSISSEFKVAAEVLLDMINNSLFADEEMDKERQVIKEEIKMYQDTPDDLVHDLALEAVFNNSPLENSILGSFKSLDGIHSEEMKEYIRDYYTLDKIVVSVAGNFSEEDVIKYFDNGFGKLQQEQKSRKISKGEYEPKFVSVEKEIEQAHICLATPIISMTDERLYPMLILSNLLGGSMSSRLFQNIREEQGLAYSVYSMAQSFTTKGYFNIYAGVAHENVEKTIRAVIKELENLRDTKVSLDEIQAAKTQLKSSYIYANENVTSRMFKNGKNLLLTGKTLEMEEVVEAYNKVDSKSIEEIKDMITDISKYSIATVSKTKFNLEEIVA